MSGDELEAAEFALIDAKKRFLGRRGWKYTYLTPSGCGWLWEKEIDGRTLLVDTNTALAIAKKRRAVES